MAPQGRMRGAFGHYCPVKGLLRQALPSSDRFSGQLLPQGRSRLFRSDKTPLLYYHYTVYKIRYRGFFMKYGFIGCGNMGGAVARAGCEGAGARG